MRNEVYLLECLEKMTGKGSCKNAKEFVNGVVQSKYIRLVIMQSSRASARLTMKVKMTKRGGYI